MNIIFHQGDLPADVQFGKAVAVDSETMGLHPLRDRLCLLQLSAGDGTCHLVQFADDNYSAPNLRALLTDPSILKIFHYARFDMAMLYQYLEINVWPVYCTKIASKLVRTYTDKHGLKDLCREILGVEMSKQQQSSDWGAAELSEDQLNYAASDVLYLHRLQEKLDNMIDREGRRDLLDASLTYLQTRVQLDLKGWADEDIFHH
ncbi:MAG TPA: ribonuclease D [Sneathiellales bacterium]|nr:ribonuclease D [Sneathiellales bacterium]